MWHRVQGVNPSLSPAADLPRSPWSLSGCYLFTCFATLLGNLSLIFEFCSHKFGSLRINTITTAIFLIYVNICLLPPHQEHISFQDGNIQLIHHYKGFKGTSDYLHFVDAPISAKNLIYPCLVFIIIIGIRPLNIILFKTTRKETGASN